MFRDSSHAGMDEEERDGAIAVQEAMRGVRAITANVFVSRKSQPQGDQTSKYQFAGTQRAHNRKGSTPKTALHHKIESNSETTGRVMRNPCCQSRRLRNNLSKAER